MSGVSCSCMDTNKPTLYASLIKAPENEVRHLLIYPVDAPREMKLVQLSGAAETPLATGTEYEMRQKANALVQLWAAEGFKQQDKVFETLERTVALAMRLGFRIVWDPRFQKMDRPPLNPTGAVPLEQWPGMTAKNGGGYVYALDQVQIHARPTLPPGHNLGVAPSDPKEFAAFMLKATALLETVGPFAEFRLGE